MTKVEDIKSEDVKDNKTIIKTGKTKKDGQFVCPNCGSSDVVSNHKTGKLRCSYCNSEFDGEKVSGIITDLTKLKGCVIGSSTTDIRKDAEDIVTLKCGGCGAEVVIDTKEAVHARCHWCRSVLSLNNKLDNGAVPDLILPFQKSKDEAQIKIEEFVHKRKFFAHPTFRREFTTENIMGVYFPYLIVDGNCHAKFDGSGEHLVRKYTAVSGDDGEVRYDADSFRVMREFDITIEDLCIESNSLRLDKSSNEQTNNIINSIMPFDTENCINYQGNYLVGYTSERRDVNVDDISEKVNKQFKDISRYAIRPDLDYYDRGVRWEEEEFRVVGTQWLSAYLPVWLYSYMETKGDSKILHYVAVNARTGETMGSVPINNPLLIGISLLIEIIFGFIGIMLFIMTSYSSDEDSDGGGIFLLLLLSGFVFYGVIYLRYRNKDARHTYESDTSNTVFNIKRIDRFKEHKLKLRNSVINGKNDDKIEGDLIDHNEELLYISEKINNVLKK